MHSDNRTQLKQFDNQKGLDRGRPAWYEAFWYLTKSAFFLSPFPWPTKLKCTILRFFGATIGVGVNIKPRVNIHFPWKLEVGDWCWIGEEVFILNFELVKIGSDSCISQRSFLCGGNHDYRDPAFSFKNAPIVIGDGAWVGAQVFVGPGVTIGEGTVITAGSVVSKNLPPNVICSGNPCIPVKPRWRTEPV